MSLWRRRRRPVGSVRWGHLRRLTPISRNFGFDRGLPVDRHYVEGFLSGHAADIRGRVLEVGGDEYTRKFGTADHIDVLHVDKDSPVATIVGDLTQPDGLPSSSYDCVICTQTLHLIFDFRTAIASIAQLLSPGGVALVTVPGITQACRYERDLWGDYWRFTSMSIRRLFEDAFPVENVSVEAFGTLPAAIGFLHGLAASELRPDELDTHDPDYEVVLSVRAVKEG